MVAHSTESRCESGSEATSPSAVISPSEDRFVRPLQRATQATLATVLSRDSHWKCLVLSSLTYSCLSALAWCDLSAAPIQIHLPLEHQTARPSASPCLYGSAYILLVFLSVFYILTLFESWQWQVRRERQCQLDVSTAYERVRRLQDAKPCLWWQAVSFHYVRRSRQVTRYRNGEAYTSTQVYQERVTTRVAEAEFDYLQCGIRDVSKELVGLEDFPATRVRFTRCFSFANSESENAYLSQRACFFRENEGLDDYVEAREGMHLKNVEFREHMMAFAEPDNQPWYTSRAAFWAAALVLLSWPLRVWLEYRTAFVHYHVEKLFGLEYRVPEPVLEMDRCPHLARASTVDSAELEWHITLNRQLVPSYSEALLMDLTDPLATAGCLPACQDCQRAHSASSIFSRRVNHACGPLSLPSSARGPGHVDLESAVPGGAHVHADPPSYQEAVLCPLVTVPASWVTSQPQQAQQLKDELAHIIEAILQT
uniref:transmembrane protein 151B-like n=1 Tax=Myxine glutinosa TaxID=7769 RepID=UPI00358FCF01